MESTELMQFLQDSDPLAAPPAQKSKHQSTTMNDNSKSSPFYIRILEWFYETESLFNETRSPKVEPFFYLRSNNILAVHLFRFDNILVAQNVTQNIQLLFLDNTLAFKEKKEHFKQILQQAAISLCDLEEPLCNLALRGDKIMILSQMNVLYTSDFLIELKRFGYENTASIIKKIFRIAFGEQRIVTLANLHQTIQIISNPRFVDQHDKFDHTQLVLQKLLKNLTGTSEIHFLVYDNNPEDLHSIQNVLEASKKEIDKTLKFSSCLLQQQEETNNRKENVQKIKYFIKRPNLERLFKYKSEKKQGLTESQFSLSAIPKLEKADVQKGLKAF